MNVWKLQLKETSVFELFEIYMFQISNIKFKLYV